MIALDRISYETCHITIQKIYGIDKVHLKKYINFNN